MKKQRLVLLIWLTIFPAFCVFSQIQDIDSNSFSTSLLDTSILPQIHYEWVSYQLKATIQIDEETISAIQVFFVNKIDSIIYLNFNKAGIELMRMVFTPDKVLYVNKMSEKYYDGDYEQISHFFKVPLNFDILQSILNGVDLQNFSPDLILIEQDILYHLTAPLRVHKYQPMQIIQDVFLNMDYTMAKNEIYEVNSDFSIDVDYGKYKLQQEIPFFTTIHIEIDNLDMLIDGELKNIKFNVPGPTTIRIPNKFTPLILE